MFRLLNLRKIANTDPQKFELAVKDLENTKPGYTQTTHDGTEAVVREMLKNGGLPQDEINRAFIQAKAAA